jgi:hypothetical protein
VILVPFNLLTSETIVYDCGPLSIAILAKSQENVEIILKRYPDSINERNRLGQAPLHLSADWLWGTTRLLAAGSRLDISDNEGAFPIYYSYTVKCWGTLETLLAADSPIPLPKLYRSGLQSLPPHIFDKVCIALADRRSRLADLAKLALSVAEYEQLLEPNSCLLHGKAWDVYKKIADKGFKIPSALKVPSRGRTVYHTSGLTSGEMEKLYNAGFREVDVQDPLRQTPFRLVASRLNNEEDVGPCLWLLSKGADPFKELDDLGTPPMHIFAAGMADLATSKIRDIHKSQQAQGLPKMTFADLKPGLLIISQDAYQLAKHDCQCRCFLHGCSPINIVFRLTLVDVYSHIPNESRDNCRTCLLQAQAFHEDMHEAAQKCVDNYREILYFFCNWVLETIYEKGKIPDTAYHELIRLFIFTELDITHTCCRKLRYYDRRLWPKSLQEIREIQEEEKEMLLELESLCTEANDRLAVYSGSFVEFLQTFLQEVRGRPQGRLSKEEIRRIEEIEQ